MSRLDALRGLSLVAMLLAGTAAPAQIFTGTGTSSVAMPHPADAEIRTPVAAPPAPRTVIRHLPGTFDGLKISGESGDLRWPVYLTATQAASAGRFRLGYIAAVSILPDDSKLTIRINDTEIGGEAIDAAHGLRTVEFALPPNVLREGMNAVSLAVRQRHRVDCSVAATYELWTKIDPVETGLVFETSVRGVADVADLPGLMPRADGSLPIHILLAGKTSPQHLQRLIRATQSIALASRALQPLVDFDANVLGGEGVDVALGLRANLLPMRRIADQIGAAGPLVRILPASPMGRPTLVVTGSTEAELDQAIATLTEIAADKGTEQGHRAAVNYPALRVEGGETLRLDAFGVGNEEFSGRFLRKSFNLMLPADFLSSDYGRGTFDLAGGYAAGLKRDAQVRVDINGKSAGIIKLPNASGAVFRHNQLFLPLGLLRPGLNRVEIFAETSRPEDTTCTADARKRFLFLDSSTLVLPTLAQVRRLPDLAVTASGGLPFDAGQAHLVVPKPDRATMGSALSLTARAAVAAGHRIDFAFSTKMPEADDGSTLIVAPAQALDPEVMRQTSLDPAAVERAWRDLAPTISNAPGSVGRWWLTDRDGPQACRLPSTARAQVPAAGVTPTVAVVPVAAVDTPSQSHSDDLLDAWTGNGRPTRSWLAVMREAYSTAKDALVDLPSKLREKFATRGTDDGIRPSASLILAQGMSRGSHENVTTIVTAPNSATLQAAVACLLDPQVWAKVHGRLSVLDASNGSVTATDATTFYYSSGSRSSLANSRLVMAGWFSLDPLAFVAVAMAMAMALSGTTLWFVRGVGRKSE